MQRISLIHVFSVSILLTAAIAATGETYTERISALLAEATTPGAIEELTLKLAHLQKPNPAALRAPDVAYIVHDELTAGDPTFNRPYGATPCQPSAVGTDVYYRQYSIRHSGGVFTGRVSGVSTGGGTLNDPVMALYAATFDPLDPCGQIVAYSDDIFYSDPEIVADLPAGVYVIVVTTFGNGETGTYTLRHNAYDVNTVPTLGEWGLILLAGLLGLVALRRLHSTARRSA